MKLCYSQKNKQAGFSLMEVLISLIILAIGLLGLSALQLTALQRNTSAYNRSIAVNLAYDIADRMRANKVAADAGDYITGIGDGPSNTANCIGNACSAGDLASFDKDEWKCQLGAYNGVACNGKLEGDLPLGDGQIVRNGDVYTITIMWDDERNGVAVNAANCGSDPEVNVTCFDLSFQPPTLF